MTTASRPSHSKSDDGQLREPKGTELSVSRLPRRLPAFLFLAIAWVYFASPVTTSFDSGYSIHLAMSLLRDGDFSLEEYRQAIPEGDYRVMEVEGRLVSTYPVGPSVVVAPGLSILKHLAKRLFGVHLHRDLKAGKSLQEIEKLFSSLLVAGAAIVLLFIARRTLSVTGSVIICLTFAFCTSAWSSVSRALWQHSPSILFIAACVWILTHPRKEEMLPKLGLWVALAFAMRPTNALLVLVLTLYVAIAYRKRFVAYILWASPVAALFIGQSLWDYGTLVPPYFNPSQVGVTFSSFLNGAAGTLISPGRGLFLYSPVLLFSIWGVVMHWRRGTQRGLTLCLATVLVGHWLLISSWFSWWGGTVFGPRLFADLLPIYMFFMILPLGEILRAPKARPLATATFVVFALWSVFVHRAGATYWPTWDWNLLPKNYPEVSTDLNYWFSSENQRKWSVDHHPERLWDWHDPPFLRRQTLLKHS